MVKETMHYNLTYKKLLSDNDTDIPVLTEIYKTPEISVDERNAASLKLFENAGFTRTSKEDELINLSYQRKEDLQTAKTADMK